MKHTGEVYVNTDSGRKTIKFYQDDDKQGPLLVKVEDQYLGRTAFQEMIENLQMVEKKLENPKELYRNAWANTVALMDMEEEEEEDDNEELNAFMDLVSEVGDKALREAFDEVKPSGSPEEEAEFQEMVECLEEEIREGMRNQ